MLDTKMVLSVLVALGVGVLLCVVWWCDCPDQPPDQTCPECPNVKIQPCAGCSLAGSGDATPDGPSADGTNTLALPYIPQFGIENAQQLINAINAAGGVVKNVQRYDESTDVFELFSIGDPSPFLLKPGEALLVQMDTGVDYFAAGAHDPMVSITLEDASMPDSASGVNFVALPYYSTVTNARELVEDICRPSTDCVANVQRFNQATSQWEVYEYSSDDGFDVIPCRGYLVTMNATVQYVPSHY
jgi:hypothetical protein